VALAEQEDETVAQRLATEQQEEDEHDHEARARQERADLGQAGEDRRALVLDADRDGGLFLALRIVQLDRDLLQRVLRHIGERSFLRRAQGADLVDDVLLVVGQLLRERAELQPQRDDETRHQPQRRDDDEAHGRRSADPTAL
jgi:hypothetical protein